MNNSRFGRTRLAVDKSKDERIQSTTFGVFWLVNAITTFLFGFTYVDPLFLPFVNLLPFAPDTAQGIAGVLGGFAALGMLDVAYIRWGHIKLHGSETNAQIDWAQRAETGSFFLSLVYTALAMAVLVFGHLLPPEWLWLLDVFGAVSFTIVCLAHLYCWRQWTEESPAVRKKKSEARTHGKMLSEKLSYQENVATEGLTLAKQNAESERDELANMWGNQWGQELRQIAAPPPTEAPQGHVAQLPPPTREPKQKEYFIKNEQGLLGPYPTIQSALDNAIRNNKTGDIVDEHAHFMLRIPQTETAPALAPTPELVPAHHGLNGHGRKTEPDSPL